MNQTYKVYVGKYHTLIRVLAVLREERPFCQFLVVMRKLANLIWKEDWRDEDCGGVEVFKTFLDLLKTLKTLQIIFSALQKAKFSR